MVLRNGKEISPDDKVSVAESNGEKDDVNDNLDDLERELLKDDTSSEKTVESTSTIPVSQIDDLIKQRLIAMFGIGGLPPPPPPPPEPTPKIPEKSPSPSSEQKRWSAWDAAYPTPPFSVRQFRDEERLSGHRNFKPWKKMVKLDLAALNLTPFIKEEAGESIKLSPSRRTMLDAQTLQYLKASVTKQVLGHLQNVYSAFAAFQMVCKMFKNVRAFDQVQLYRKFGQLRFKNGFNAVRFCADFNQLVDEYKVMGVNFPDSYLATIFLEKIDGIFDPTSQYFSFFTTITALPPEIQTLSYIKSRFLAVDKMSFQGKSVQENLSDNKNCLNTGTLTINKNVEKCLPNSSENLITSKSDEIVRVCFLGEKRKDTAEKENVPPKRFKQQSGNLNKSSHSTSTGSKTSSNSPYTAEQLAQLRKMSAEEKNKIRCHNCGQYFHQGKDCKNTGRMCFCCFGFGHEQANCPKNKGLNNLQLESSMFDKSIVVLIDSGASHHIVNKKDWLVNFRTLNSQLLVQTAITTEILQSKGEGSFPIVILFGKSKSILL